MTRSDSRTASEANRPYRPTGASLAALILATLCFGAVMLLHLARGDIDPMRQVMSEYANGSHGPVMTVVFYSFALSTFALAFRLRRALNRRGVAKLIVGLLTVAGIGLLAAGIFEVERPLVPDTVEEMIHSNATVTAFTLLIASMLLLALVCRIDPRWWAFRWTPAPLSST